MRKFILVDHSLRDTGGHHYPYAASVLQAAASAGYAPALATHRDFGAAKDFPPHWPLHPLFPQVSYSAHALDTQSAPRAADGPLARLFAPWRSLWQRRQRRRHIRRFAAACMELFAKLPLEAGDLVFFPTASELDLQGLALFIAQSPSLPAAEWHAQLHFGIHREREWRLRGDASAAAAMQASLRASLQQCRGIRLRLWCTTEPLADQYRALGVADFAVLPYPVHPSFAAYRQLRSRPMPARIACLGHARREKNQRALPALLQELWRDAFAPGHAQLVVQNARPALRKALGACAEGLSADMAPARPFEPVDCSAGTLDQEQYARLVCGSDIGLLLYDARRYHDRCSGVLLEMLVAGVPVVVPARSWLSEQIAAANHAWLRECAAALRAAGRLQRQQPAADEFEMPEGTRGILIAIEVPEGAERGAAVEVRTHGTSVEDAAPRSLWIEAPRGESRGLRLLPLPSGCQRLTVRAPIAVTVDAVTGPLPPLGAIGLAIDAPGDAAGALRDILGHIEHYKRWSAQQAARWTEDCSSGRIVERLGERA